MIEFFSIISFHLMKYPRTSSRPISSSRPAHVFAEKELQPCKLYAEIFNVKMCQWPPCAAVLLAVVSLYLVVLTSCQSIEAFDDSSCLTPASNMVPSIISFDAAKPECLLIRDETTLPLVDSFDVDFYASSEQCSAGVPIVVSYSNSYRPVTPMPIIPSPVSTRNMSFCFQSGYRPSNGVFEWSRTTTSRKLTMAVRSSTVPGARFSKGLAGRRAETFLCSLTPGSTLFSTPEDAQPDYQSRDHPVVMKYKSFIQYLGPTIKYGLQMFVVNQSEIVQYQQLQSTQVCEADTCCTTGSGPATIHFRVNKSSVQYKSVTKAYGKVISCNSGNLMYQTYSDAKCTVGRNAPKVLRADGSCQMTPMPSQLDDGADADYGYGTYFKGRCQTSDVSPPAKSSVLVTAFSDASCSQPNIDIKPSPINCGTSQCCLIAKRSGVNYLDGGVLQLFSSSVDCQNNITAHPLSLPANSPGFSYNHQELLKVLNITGFPPGLVAPASDHWQCVQDCQTNFPNSLSDCHCPLWQFGRDSRYFGRIFPRKPRMFRCFQNMDYQTNFNSHSMGYFAQYLGNGKWNFDIRMFQDYDCKQPIFSDTSVPSDRMCAVDTCCKVGNSSASFFFRIPSSTLKFDNKARDVYARLLSCNGDVAMFHQYEDNACSIYDQGDLSVMLPRVLRADGSCAAVPSTEYAIDSFYTAKCSLPTPLVKSVSVKAYSDATCSAPSSSVQPQTITCQINECCIVRQATESNAAVYGRAVSCDSQAMLFNTYSDSRCIVANQYMPMALHSDDSCQVDQTGYTQFYRASCKILPKPPASPPSETLLCPKDLNGNVCGGAEFGSCSAVYSASGYRIPVCICVQDTGFFNGQICTSAAAQSSVAGLVNKTFWRQQEQAGRLNALSCADPVKPVKCPNSSWVPQQKFGQCQTSMSACASNSAAFRTYVESQALLCPEKTSFDSVLMQCVPADAPRTPVFSCPPTMMRCSNGSCDTAANCASVQAPACPSGSTGSYLCPGNRVACAASLSECSKKEPWNGCPVNQLQCPNRPGVCAASLQDCSSVPGP